MKNNDDTRYEELKRELFIWGKDRIEEFLGYSDDISGMSKDVIENLMDEIYAQMPDDVLNEFFDKYNIKEDKTMPEMNIGKLKELIENLPDDMPVFVACQGYCNYDFKKDEPCEETDTFLIVRDGKAFLTDECAVETSDGDTL